MLYWLWPLPQLCACAFLVLAPALLAVLLPQFQVFQWAAVSQLPAQPQRGVLRSRQVVEAAADAVPLVLPRAVQVPAVLALPRAVQVLGALIPAVLVLLHDVTLGGDVLTLVQAVLITTTAITTITTAITPTTTLTMTPMEIRLTTIRPALIVTVASLTIIPTTARNNKV